MDALREIVKSNSKEYNLHLPEWAVGREVELILLPLLAEGEGMVKKSVALGMDKEHGPFSVLGFANKFRKTRTTQQWMQELREGENN